MTTVLDASAILAFAQGERGADTVEEALVARAMCGTANWSEVAQKVLGADRDWDLVRALLHSYDIRLEPVSADDAEWAARRWRRGEGLSLGDRLCMALAERTDSTILTSDTSWSTDERIRQIR